MALNNKWDVKNDVTYVLQFFSLISDSLGSVWQLFFNSGRQRQSLLEWDNLALGQMQKKSTLFYV